MWQVLGWACRTLHWSHLILLMALQIILILQMEELRNGVVRERQIDVKDHASVK